MKRDEEETPRERNFFVCFVFLVSLLDYSHFFCQQKNDFSRTKLAGNLRGGEKKRGKKGVQGSPKKQKENKKKIEEKNKKEN